MNHIMKRSNSFCCNKDNISIKEFLNTLGICFFNKKFQISKKN